MPGVTGSGHRLADDRPSNGPRRPRRPRTAAIALSVVLAITACSSTSDVRQEFADLLGLTDDEIGCVDDLADPEHRSPYGVLADCLDLDRLRAVASNVVDVAIDLARESGELEEVEAIAAEQGLDFGIYQMCIADRVATLDDDQLRFAFDARTGEQLGERLSAPFVLECFEASATG